MQLSIRPHQRKKVWKKGTSERGMMDGVKQCTCLLAKITISYICVPTEQYYQWVNVVVVHV